MVVTILYGAVVLLWAAVIVQGIRLKRPRGETVLNAVQAIAAAGLFALSFYPGGRSGAMPIVFGLVFATNGILAFARLRTPLNAASAQVTWRTFVYAILVFGYILAATALPLLWVSKHVTPSLQFPVGVAFLILAYGLPVAFFIWRTSRSTAQRATIGKAERFKRSLFVFAVFTVPCLVFFGAPAIFTALLPDPQGSRVTLIWVLTAFALFIGLWAWGRYYWLPRRAPGSVTFEMLAKRRGLALDHVGESRDPET